MMRMTTMQTASAISSWQLQLSQGGCQVVTGWLQTFFACSSFSLFFSSSSSLMDNSLVRVSVKTRRRYLCGHGQLLVLSLHLQPERLTQTVQFSTHIRFCLLNCSAGNLFLFWWNPGQFSLSTSDIENVIFLLQKVRHQSHHVTLETDSMSPCRRKTFSCVKTIKSVLFISWCY